jgi:hypothetical protein
MNKKQIAEEERLYAERRKILDTWIETTKGAPAPVVARAMNNITRGIDWTGSALEDMKRCYTAAYFHYKMGDDERRCFHQELARQLEMELERLQKKYKRLISKNVTAGEKR